MQRIKLIFFCYNWKRLSIFLIKQRTFFLHFKGENVTEIVHNSISVSKGEIRWSSKITILKVCFKSKILIKQNKIKIIKITKKNDVISCLNQYLSM